MAKHNMPKHLTKQQVTMRHRIKYGVYAARRQGVEAGQHRAEEEESGQSGE